MSNLDVVRRRMAAQRLTGARHGSAADVVRSLGAMQAQEFAEAKWSIAQRMDGEPTDAEIDAAFDRGEIVRTHILRPTWHFVVPEDLRWIQRHTAPRVQRANRYWYGVSGLDEDLLRRGTDLVAGELADGQPRTRKELGGALAGGGLDLDAQAVNCVTHFAELEAVICSGPRRGKQQTYVLAGERFPAGPDLSREEALAELARRYVIGHGPATARDFSWWSGLTLAGARTALEGAGDALVTEEGADGTTLYVPAAEAEPVIDSGGLLIPKYDELGVAFKDLRMAHAKPPPEGMMARPILIDGVTVGSWRRVIGRGSVTLEATLLTKLGHAAKADLEDAAERFARFLGLPLKLLKRQAPGRAPRRGARALRAARARTTHRPAADPRDR